MRLPMLYRARVWCGVMPRRGGPENAGTHMMFCQDCRRVKRAYWAAVKAQSGAEA